MLKALPAVGAMDGPDVHAGLFESTDDFLDDHVEWDGVSLPPDTKRTSLSRASSLTSPWPGDSIAGSVAGGDGEDRSGGEPKSAVAVGRVTPTLSRDRHNRMKQIMGEGPVTCSTIARMLATSVFLRQLGGAALWQS